MLENDFWGEVISVYTDAEAQEDGVLIDVENLGVKFNERIINRVTVGVTLAIGLKEKQPATIKNNLEFIAVKSSFDGDGADAWGVFEPDARFGNEKFWLVPNEVEGYTLLLPDEY